MRADRILKCLYCTYLSEANHLADHRHSDTDPEQTTTAAEQTEMLQLAFGQK